MQNQEIKFFYIKLHSNKIFRPIIIIVWLAQLRGKTEPHQRISSANHIVFLSIYLGLIRFEPI